MKQEENQIKEDDKDKQNSEIEMVEWEREIKERVKKKKASVRDDYGVVTPLGMVDGSKMSGEEPSLEVQDNVRKDGFKLEGSELFKEGFRKLFKTRMNLSQEPIDSAIQLAKTASKSYSTRKDFPIFQNHFLLFPVPLQVI